MKLSVTLFVFSALLPLVVDCAHDPLSYEFSTSLHTNYNLYWNKPSDGKICMAVEVDTLGWVGLGFSPNGGMVDSDIMMAWVIDGEATITDSYAVSRSLPVLDEQEDFELVAGYEEGGKTVIQFCRKVETCDERDRSILSGTTKVVYSWSNSDPNPTPLKHVTKGFQNVNLIGAKTDFSPSVTSNTTVVEFTMGNISIPNEASVYWCRTIRYTQPAQKNHVIKIGVVLDPRNTQYIYHIILYVCPLTFPELQGDCNNLTDPIRTSGAYGYCVIAFSGWALGASDIEFPLDVGMPIGGSETFDTLILEVHYNNPSLVSGIVDDSGVRWYYTDQVRMHDLAILNIGHLVNNQILIPPKTKSFLVPAICPSECTSLFPHDIHVIGSFLHSRTSGVALWTQLIREGKEIELLDVNLNYDSNFQEYLAQDTPITVKPGDELIFNCIFNTESRDEFTQGGPSINDEACINFIFYYPKMDTAFCLSSYDKASSFNAALDSFQCNNVDVNGSTTYQELVSRASNIEWTDKVSRTLEVSQILDPNGHTAYCGGLSLNVFSVDIPKPGVDYEVFPSRYDTCGKYNGSYYPGGSTADYYYNCTTNESYFEPIGPTDSASSLSLLPTVMWLLAATALYLF